MPYGFCKYAYFFSVFTFRYESFIIDYNPAGVSNKHCLLSLFFISSPEPKAHRSAYRILMLRRPSVVRQPFSKIFSETAWPIKAKFYLAPPWVGGTKVCSRHLGHMTKMAAMPIYGKNPSKIFSRTDGPISTKLPAHHSLFKS